ncbi:EamA family transporter [Saccharopolyspora rhizosphaerae]|uniref:EamA family transporter n=1 Tax=Saccharopolyspora rhizosphaerae TaxID=2492662 RepID=UPI001F39A78C|nr:EamA family transporter [Saccharopolyspora rhizosphaerae]
MAIGPVARVSQVRVTQPVMTIVWATVILAEPLTWPTLLGALAVIVCAILSVRTRLGL